MEKVFDKELISVVIPVYNVEKYLDKCMESVLNQTYSNIEVILVDDGSTDKSGKICDEYQKKDKRVVVYHKENGGLSDARNYGINKSHGEYITFIDSDDFVEQNYVEFLYKLIKENQADIAMGKQYVRYPEKIINTGSGNTYNVNAHDCMEKLLYSEDFDVSAWAKLYKKELFKSIKFPKGMVFEDAGTTYKLILQSKKIVLKSEPIYNYIIRNNSITNSKFNIKKMDMIYNTQKMVDDTIKVYPDLFKAGKRRMMYAYLSTITQYARNNSKDKKIRKELMDYIKKNRNEVLKNPRTPKRDRIALATTFFGYPFFKFSWKLYERIHYKI